MENTDIIAIIMGSLGIVAWFLIRNWLKNWETRLIAHDARLDRHDERHNTNDVIVAEINTKLASFTKVQDEVREDVKELLRQNGNRSSA